MVAVRDVISDQRIAHHADAMGVGDRDRRIDRAQFLDPGDAGHLAVAV
jgi:hypothetical protein